MGRTRIISRKTLPKAPNPECLCAQVISEQPAAPKPVAKGAAVTPEVRAKAFRRWDTNKDGIRTLDEYQAGLNGQENLDARCKTFDKNGDGKTYTRRVHRAEYELTPERNKPS